MPSFVNGETYVRLCARKLSSFVEDVLSCKVIPNKANESLEKESHKESPESKVTPESKFENIIDADIIDVAVCGINKDNSA